MRKGMSVLLAVALFVPVLLVTGGCESGGGNSSDSPVVTAPTTLVWNTSKDAAFAYAQANNLPLIFLEVGTDLCPYCKLMHNSIVYENNPPLNSLLIKNYSMWFADMNTDTDYQSIAVQAPPIPNVFIVDANTRQVLASYNAEGMSGNSQAEAQKFYNLLQSFSAYYK